MKYYSWSIKTSPEENRAAGFSLMEILISTAILAILFLSMGMMFSRGRGYIKGQGDRRVALALANHRLEELSAMTFAELEAYDAMPGDGNPRIFINTENPPFDTFDCPAPPCGNPLDGTAGRPNYIYFNLQTVLDYATVTAIATGFQVDTCADDTCEYVRARITVSLTDVQEDTGLRGYFEPVVLEGVISDWK